MASLLLCYPNRIGAAATLAAGASSFHASYPVANLADDDVNLVARTQDATRAKTRFRFDLGAAYPLRAVALARHNLSADAQWRLRLGTAPLDLDMAIATALDERLTVSGSGWLITGGSFTGQHSATAGTIYAEFDTPASGTRPIVSLDDNTANEQIRLYSSGTDLKLTITDGGVTQCDITIGTIGASTTYKVAVAWSANDFAACLSGGTVGTDTSGTLPTVDRMRLSLDQAGNTQGGALGRVLRWPTRLPDATLQAITFYGPDHSTVQGYNTGFVDALQLTFQGDEPAAWGRQYDVLDVFDEVQARYGTVEIVDTSNPDSYVEIGRLAVAGGLQPARGLAYGRVRDFRQELSATARGVTGRKFGTARERPRAADIELGWLTQAEANRVHEMQAELGVLGEVLYVPDPADMAHSQRFGGLGLLRELSAIDYPYPLTRAIPIRWEQKQ